MAACNGQAEDVVFLLLAAQSGASAEGDANGNTPLHVAVSCQAPADVVG